MTHAEQATLKDFKRQAIKSLIGWGIAILGAAVIGLTSFYYTTKEEVSNQREAIQELKEAVRSANPQEISRMKSDLSDIQNKLEELSIDVQSTTKIMESFKHDQERKVDKMMDLLIEIKRTN